MKDVSASIPESESARAERFLKDATSNTLSPYAIVEFAGSPFLIRGFDGNQPLLGPLDKTQTDISGALDFAALLFPTDKARRIVLLSDGNDTIGRDQGRVGGQLAERGIEWDFIPLDPSRGDEASISSLEIPESVKEGIPFTLPVRLFSTATFPGELRLYKDNLLIAEKDVELKPGETIVNFPSVTLTGRTAIFEAELVPSRDTHSENNRLKRLTPIEGPLNVLLVDQDVEKAGALANALKQSGLNVEVRPDRRFPDSLTDLQVYDLILFSNVPASHITDKQAEAIETWVRDFGGGFIMLGGEDSFSSGGYFKTPFERLLPITMDHDDRLERPVAALLVVLDRSGSMTAQSAGQTKMSLANEGAALALEVLQPSDFFGVDAVDTRVQHVVPLAKAVDNPLIAKRIMAITSGGGGIYIYTALAEALRQLRETPAKVKHVILFSDAADAEDKYSEGDSGLSALDLAAAMLSARITVSVVALGNESDRDTAFLRSLASQGGGRFYLTSDAASLPRIFTAETMRATQPGLIEDAFHAQEILSTSATSGIDWKASPFLLGYNATRIKPTATLVLSTERNDPLLATWRYGLGQAAAFTSDAKPQWASEWMAWPGFGKFWAQLAAATARSSDVQNLTATLTEEAGKLEVEIDARTANGLPRNNLNIRVNGAPDSGAALSLLAAQIAPGRYHVSFSTPAKAMLIGISENELPGRPLLLAWTRGYPAEFVLRKEPLRQISPTDSEGRAKSLIC